MERLPLLLLLLSSMLGSVYAADDPVVPEKPKPLFRQFPQAPDVHYFENFQAEKSIWLEGKIEQAPVPLYPGVTDMVLRGFQPTDGNNPQRKVVRFMMDLALIKDLKVPDKTPVNSLYISMNIYCDAVGDFEFRMTDGVTNWSKVRKTPKVGGWATVELPFTEFETANRPAKAGSIFQKFYVIFTPKDAAKYPVVCIDEVIMTVNQRPSMLLPAVKQIVRAEQDIMRTYSRDGFEYNLPQQERLEKALSGKPRSKKTVLVIAPRAADSAGLMKQLETAAAKFKDVKLVPATLPDGTAYNGVDDIRMFLPYSINKSNAGVALIMLGLNEAFVSVHTSKYLDAAVERALAAGCVPIFVGPGAAPTLGDRKTRFDTFVLGVKNICSTRGTIWIDPGFALKDTPAFDTAGELNAAGMAKVSPLIWTATKHFMDSFK